jgi:hypothetical protein
VPKIHGVNLDDSSFKFSSLRLEAFLQLSSIEVENYFGSIILISKYSKGWSYNFK